MKQTELPLYLKVSSIYNKIMQLAIAISIIVVLMNLWIFISEQNQQTIDEHFSLVSGQYIDQTASGINQLLDGDKQKIQHYIDDLSANEWIKDISLYDETGLLVFASKEQSSINDLYGVSLFKTNLSAQFTPFVRELRDEKLKGYVRITIARSQLTDELSNTAEDNFSLFRLMLILAGVVGFLLTRGLNRFSRQGFRIAKS